MKKTLMIFLNRTVKEKNPPTKIKKEIRQKVEIKTVNIFYKQKFKNSLTSTKN